MTDTYRNYLFDLGYEIKLLALDAKRERDAVDGDDRQFQSGRVMAFLEVIALMQQQAEGFQIPLADLRLDDINPERDLL